MLTNVINMTSATDQRRRDAGSRASAQKVVIVNGGDEVIELLETVLEAGHYDIVFVESTAHAYSQIKKVQPNLIILCVNMDEHEGFRVLSMLKLDPETRGIPLLTYATGDDHDQQEEPETFDDEVFAPRPEPRMN